MSDKRELDVTKLALSAVVDPPPARGTWIGDRSFMEQLSRLKALRQFLLVEGVSVNPDDTSGLADLNVLRFKAGGRLPDADDWRTLESCTQRLYAYLTIESLRRKFLLSQAPSIIAWLPVALGFVAVNALTCGIFLPDFLPGNLGNYVRFVCYLYWLASLGGVGAIAFISINTLSIQSTATFDVNNKRLILTRVVLGALFGMALSIAYGFPSFLAFCMQITNGDVHGVLPPSSGASTAATGGLVGSSAMLLLPFILGFSTTLVIAILNRFVESVGTFFGAPSSSAVHDVRSAGAAVQAKAAAAEQGPIAPAG
jgi:hypothetical protein